MTEIPTKLENEFFRNFTGRKKYTQEQKEMIRGTLGYAFFIINYNFTEFAKAIEKVFK